MISTRILVLSITLLVSASLPAQKLKDKINAKLNEKSIRLQKESSLADKSIKEISMVLPEKITLAPGAAFSIGMTALLTDTTEMKTTGFAGGKVKWENYVVTVTGGRFSDGTVYINSNPKSIPGYLVTVTCALAKDSSVFKTKEFKLNFVANYVANFDGRNGQSGQSGRDGQRGATGANDKQGTGAAGGSGENGGDGGNGGNGETGEGVDVYVTAFKDASGTTFLKVYCKSRNSQKEEYFIVNPAGGSVTINARGGDGGSGGHGGQGGGGGNGGDGHQYGGNAANDSPHGGGGKGGNGGNGGNGGMGGNGGGGGNVTIYLDPSAAGYESIFIVNTQGGGGGNVGFPGKGSGPGSSGSGDKNGGQGTTGGEGQWGKSGGGGMTGPKPTIRKEKVTIDWDAVAK